MNEPEPRDETVTRPDQSEQESAERRAPRSHFSDDYQLMITSLSEAVDNSAIQRIEIAAALGKPKAYVTKILRGNQAATLTEIRNICLAADINFIQWVASVDTLLRAKNLPSQDKV